MAALKIPKWGLSEDGTQNSCRQLIAVYLPQCVDYTVITGKLIGKIAGFICLFLTSFQDANNNKNNY